MADFGVNSTTLSAPQGAGTDPVAAVQEKTSGLGMSPIIGDIVSIFSKGLANTAKEDAEKRKNAIVGEYINNEKVYTDAMATGQWNSSQVSVASRANYNKMLAAYPEYVQDITQARAAVYGGTETGEAQKKEEAATKLRESDIQAASNMGYNFYSGMSEDAQNKTIDAYKTARRVEQQWDQDTKRAAETRAQNAENRSATTFTMSVDDHVAKENAVAGAREVAGKNFESLIASTDDLKAKMASGMPYEQALMIHNGNLSRINAGLLSIAGKNPEMAAPWIKLFGDMDANIKEQLDPRKKTADEVKALRDQYDILVTKSKIAAVERNPALLKAVTATALFPGESMVTMSNAPAVSEWLLSASGVDPKLGTPKQLVGKDDKQLFNIAQSALENLQSGKIPAADVPKATVEATNVINTLLKQTEGVSGDMNPQALKEASKFFSSTAFGKLALDGKVDKQTAANAQHVFQVQYEPAVKRAITSRLEDIGVTGSVDIKVVGGNVVFQKKVTEDNRTYMQMLGDGFNTSKGLAGIDRNANVAGVKEAEAGLNQLIRLHAHLEGTTDYANYWEKNKHILMPSVFPDPAKLKPGQVVDGHKYIGGNYRDRSNWIAEPKSKQ